MEINYKQLIFAREYRKLSQTELASQINGLSQSNLSKYEKGVGSLSEEIIKKIIEHLGFPEKFFSKKISNKVENAHYRKRATITKSDRLDIEYSNKVIGYLIDQMANALEWPEYSLKSVDLEEGHTPHSAAQFTRRQFGISPDEPVKNINNLLESHGIIVVEFDTIEKFDGVSFISDYGYPVIVINKSFSNDRKRFTLAHELGHLILHLDGSFIISEFRDKELEANKFASEFLMPAEHIKSSLQNLKLSYLSELKRFWLTSMASIVRRAKDLGAITSDKYTYLNIELSRKGYKKNEPIEVYIDDPQLFITGYNMHKLQLEYSDEELADAFGLPLDIIKRYCVTDRGNTKLRVVV
ncbi:MAG: XRE family transcriptional regulator [Crocinitomicaceae bacterium]